MSKEIPDLNNPGEKPNNFINTMVNLANSLLEVISKRHPSLSQETKEEIAQDILLNVVDNMDKGKSMAFLEKIQDGQYNIEIHIINEKSPKK